MASENISQDFRLKNVDKIRNYFFEEINQNDLMIKVHKKYFTVLNYIELRSIGQYLRKKGKNVMK